MAAAAMGTAVSVVTGAAAAVVSSGVESRPEGLGGGWSGGLLDPNPSEEELRQGGSVWVIRPHTALSTVVVEKKVEPSHTGNTRSFTR